MKENIYKIKNFWTFYKRERLRYVLSILLGWMAMILQVFVPLLYSQMISNIISK